MNNLEIRLCKNFARMAAMRILVKRVENQLGSGTPDALITNRRGGVAWVEMKAKEEWPKRAATLPLKGRFEKGQLSFLKEWISWKGNAFVMLFVEDECILFNPSLDLEAMTKAELLSSAVAVGYKACLEHLESL